MTRVENRKQSHLPKKSVRSVKSLTQSTYLLCPGKPAEYCDELVCPSLCVSVCVCVYLSAIISLEPLDRSSRNFCADPLRPWFAPPLAALRYVMCFRFIDDVTLAIMGRTWRLAMLRYRDGVWCLWMPCLQVCNVIQRRFLVYIL